jgi:hypothetical protein
MSMPSDRLRRRIFLIVTGPRFPTIRLLFWTAQIPPALAFTWLSTSVRYVVFLSLAALIESAGTDVVEAWKFSEESDGTTP